MSAGIVAIEHIVEKQIMPALARLAGVVKKDFNLKIEPLGKHFKEYLRRTYEKHSILNTLVFHNQQKQLRDLYIPLTLVQEGVDYKKTKDGIIIDGYPAEYIAQYRRILIADTAGMGKSTLTKIMFLSAIDQQAGIPFFVELRRLSQGHTLLDELREQLDSLTDEFDDSLMRSFFHAGGFIFFFDGFDEIGLADRKAVTDDIKRFIEKAPDNYYVLTSRYEQGLASFGDFRSMNIRPLSQKEAYSLLRRYDSDGETSRRLIEKIDTEVYQRISEFLQNPLLVSLLFIGFEYKPEIPLKIHLFYDQVFEAYFNNHDLSKDGYYTHEKQSGLDMADFGKVLRAIGFICLRKHRLAFDRNDFLDVLDKAGKLSCVSPKSSEALMHDLLHAVPLFCMDGLNYKWVHKSMQEYFAADFINRDCADKKESILERIASSSEINNYMNLLELYADLDSKSFQKIIALPVLKSFLSYVDKPVNVDNPEMVDQVRLRRQIIYGKDVYLYLFTKEEAEMPISAAFGHLKSLVDQNTITQRIISHTASHDLRSVVYASNKDEWLIKLIEKKNPQATEYLIKDWRIRSVKYLNQGVLFHITESFMIEDMEAYKEINMVAGSILGPRMSYSKAKHYRESINLALRENEDVFKDFSEF